VGSYTFIDNATPIATPARPAIAGAVEAQRQADDGGRYRRPEPPLDTLDGSPCGGAFAGGTRPVRESLELAKALRGSIGCTHGTLPCHSSE
jgi:hypothetical protein